MKKLLSLTVVITVLLIFHYNDLHAQTKSKTKSTAKTTSASTSSAPAPTEEELKPVVAEKGKEVVAIYPFTTSGRTYYDYALNAGTAVEAGFVRSKRFTVAERSRFGIIKEEDLFKEANTQEIVQKASRLGAKIVVTGHVIAATNATGTQNNIIGGSNYKYIAQLSLSFKIIDVASGEITKSETILGKGEGNTPAEAMQGSYQDVDRQARMYVAEYLPQRFEYASDVEVDKKNKLKKFKIWGGSDQGLKEGDLIEIYRLSYTVSPKGKKVEEKKLLGTAKIIEINSTESSTCDLQKSGDLGETLLTEIKAKPESIVFEYKGSVKKKSLFNL
jgi:curli biogenesis system outer membrane secretion channel CsgG